MCRLHFIIIINLTGDGGDKICIVKHDKRKQYPYTYYIHNYNKNKKEKKKNIFDNDDKKLNCINNTNNI